MMLVHILELGHRGGHRLLVALQRADNSFLLQLAGSASAVRRLDDVHGGVPELNLELLGNL